MGSSKQQLTEHTRRRKSDKTRLESWKAIANYLHRSVRTVRRWEENEHLPVYRHKHKKGASVYAFCSELDTWREGHRKADAPVLAGRSENREGRFFVLSGRNAAILVVIAFFGGIVAGRILVNQAAPGLENPQSVQSAQASGPAHQNNLIVLPESEVGDITYWSDSIARAAVMPVVLAWVDGRMQDALQENQKILKQLARYPLEAQPDLIEYLVDFSLAMGRIDATRNIVAVVKDASRRDELQAKIMFASGHRDTMRAYFQRGNRFGNESTPLFMAMTGLIEEAVELNSELGSSETRSGRLNVILAIAAMVGEDKEEAESRLRAATTQLVDSDQSYYLVAVDMLSGLLMSKGNLVDAIRLLERTASQRDIAASNKSSLFWLMCQRQLALLYREAGREADALELENALRDRLTFADEDFPLAKGLADT